jgi:pimeloyl-ACP methyl ester carboxylesterase
MTDIIFLHGALGTSITWEPYFKLAKNDDFSCYSFDFSGHGSKSLDGFGIEYFAEELKQFISMNKLVKPNVIGYSMGGYVALYLKQINNNLIGKVLTLNTKLNWSPEFVEREIQNLNPELILSKVPAFAKKLEELHGLQWSQLVNEVKTMMIQLSRDPNLNAEILKEFGSEICLCASSNDKMVSIEETVAFSRNLKNAQFACIPYSSHALESIASEVFWEIARKHFQS